MWFSLTFVGMSLAWRARTVWLTRWKRTSSHTRERAYALTSTANCRLMCRGDDDTDAPLPARTRVAFSFSRPRTRPPFSDAPPFLGASNFGSSRFREMCRKSAPSRSILPIFNFNFSFNFNFLLIFFQGDVPEQGSISQHTASACLGASSVP